MNLFNQIPTIYLNSIDNKARYVLGQTGKKTMVVFGVNPSTATDQNFDRTVTKVIGFAARNGFDGWAIVNLYPQRATNPADLDLICNLGYHHKNVTHIEELVKNLPEAGLIAAWGNLIGSRSYISQCLADIIATLPNEKQDWRCIGSVTKDGHPRHPSRAGYQLELTPFNISEYLNNFV